MELITPELLWSSSSITSTTAASAATLVLSTFTFHAICLPYLGSFVACAMFQLLTDKDYFKSIYTDLPHSVTVLTGT